MRAEIYDSGQGVHRGAHITFSTPVSGKFLLIQQNSDTLSNLGLGEIYVLKGKVQPYFASHFV